MTSNGGRWPPEGAAVRAERAQAGLFSRLNFPLFETTPSRATQESFRSYRSISALLGIYENIFNKVKHNIEETLLLVKVPSPPPTKAPGCLLYTSDAADE